MKNKNHNMSEYYNDRAPEYEQIYYRDNKPRRQEIEDEKKRLIKLAVGRTVLEIACGTGYWTEQLAQTAQSVVASDLSEQMIVEAKKKQLLCPVEFIQADMYKLPLENKLFDLVAVGFWFSHEPKQQYDNFFDMLENYLTKTGKIWLIDNNPPAEGPTIHSTGTDEFGNNFKKRFLDSGVEYIILKNYFSKEQLQEILSERFKLDRLTYQTYYWAVELSRK